MANFYFSATDVHFPNSHLCCSARRSQGLNQAFPQRGECHLEVILLCPVHPISLKPVINLQFVSRVRFKTVRRVRWGMSKAELLSSRKDLLAVGYIFRLEKTRYAHFLGDYTRDFCGSGFGVQKFVVRFNFV